MAVWDGALGVAAGTALLVGGLLAVNRLQRRRTLTVVLSDGEQLMGLEILATESQERVLVDQEFDVLEVEMREALVISEIIEHELS